MRVSFVLRSIEIQPLFIDLYIFFIREEKEVGRWGRRGVGGEMGNMGVLIIAYYYLYR